MAPEPVLQSDLREHAVRWLGNFETALTTRDATALADCFVEDVHWRDLAGLRWRVGKVRGCAQVVDALIGTVDSHAPSSWRLSAEHPAPQRTSALGTDVVEAFLEFGTRDGSGDGVVRLVAGADGRYRAWLLFTRLRSLDGAGRQLTSEFGRRYGFEPASPRETWKEHRDRTTRFENSDPEVLVVGGGHSGVIAATHLGNLGVATLLIERFPRLGDVWRRRYQSLALHFPTLICTFPFLPFPDTFPDYLSKDQLADWIELYAKAMEVTAWTSTELTSAGYDPEARRWEARVVRDEREHVLRPRHLVMATGFIGNIPRMPQLDGLDRFAGTVVHSAHYSSGRDYADQDVLIIGAGTSAHDIALDLVRWGARPTMVQRSPISIIRLETLDTALRSVYRSAADIPLADLRAAANVVFPPASEFHALATARNLELDADLIARLQRAGFRVDMDPASGWQIKAWRGGSGYYIDVGASEAVADGRIRVIQADEVARIVEDGIERVDGTMVGYQAIVCATGFHNSIVDIAKIFGDDVARGLGDIHILNDSADGEWSNAWTPTTQEGLWFMSAGPPQTRAYAPTLALQVWAHLHGLADGDGEAQ